MRPSWMVAIAIAIAALLAACTRDRPKDAAKDAAASGSPKGTTATMRRAATTSPLLPTRHTRVSADSGARRR